jgi:hypothetical protein
MPHKPTPSSHLTPQHPTVTTALTDPPPLLIRSPTWKTGPTPTTVLACQADGPSTTSPQEYCRYVHDASVVGLCNMRLQKLNTPAPSTNHHAPKDEVPPQQGSRDTLYHCVESKDYCIDSQLLSTDCAAAGMLSPLAQHTTCSSIEVQHHQWLKHAHSSPAQH